MSENKQQNALKEKQADVRMETKVCKETPSQNLNFESNVFKTFDFWMTIS